MNASRSRLLDLFEIGWGNRCDVFLRSLSCEIASLMSMSMLILSIRLGAASLRVDECTTSGAIRPGTDGD